MRLASGRREFVNCLLIEVTIGTYYIYNNYLDHKSLVSLHELVKIYMCYNLAVTRLCNYGSLMGMSNAIYVTSKGCEWLPSGEKYEWSCVYNKMSEVKIITY